MRRIAVTGSYGKTGQAVLKAAADHWGISALARNEAQADDLRAAGHDVVIGDMADRATLAALFDGADAVYHICPNFHPDELAIATTVADAAADVGQLVYHSVLHPQTEAMPHHWRKLRAEEMFLAQRPGNVTFLRPAPYVQNLLPYLRTALVDGQLRLPYSVDLKTAMVDLLDVGRAAVAVLTDGFEAGSGWDLCGVGAISHREVASMVEATSGRPIEAIEVAAPDDTHPEVAMMFQYMGGSGLPGSTGQLRALIGEPTPLEVTLQRLLGCDGDALRQGGRQ